MVYSAPMNPALPIALLRSLLGALAVAIALTAPVHAQSVQRIAAIVNDEVISAFDLEQRLLLLLSSSGREPSAEMMRQAQPQVLDSLVEERLQLQEAQRLNIQVSDAEIADGIRFIEEQNRMQSGDLERVLGRSGVGVETLRQQIRTQIAWGKVISRRLRPTVTVGQDEVNAAMARAEQTQGRSEYLVSEIFLSIDSPARRQTVANQARDLVAQLRGGANFAVVAQQNSQGVDAAEGGDMGWVDLAEVPEAIGRVLPTLQVNQVSDPITTQEGIFILLLRDRRAAAAPADPSQVTVNVKQVFLPIAANAPASAAESQMALARTISATVGGCTDLDNVIKDVNTPQSGDIGTVKLADLPPRFRTAVQALNVGQASDPVRTEEGVHVLMVCDRAAPEIRGPNRDAIENAIGQARLSMMARRYIRDLRRDAVVEYR